MRSIRRIAWHAIDVYAEYCEKGYSKEAARDKAAQEVLECYDDVSLTNPETTHSINIVGNSPDKQES